MKKKIQFIIFLSVVFSVHNVYAQYCMNQTGSQIWYTNSGNFFDSGCNTANYSNQENGYITFCPTSSCMVSLTFVSIALMDASDVMVVYDGGSSGPILATFQGPLSVTSLPMITSTDVSGCLTIRFQSNASGIAAGWWATIGCQAPTGISENQLLGSFISSGVENNSLSFNLASPLSLTLNIFSADGKKVSDKNYSLAAGQHQLALPTENLEAGIYFCRVMGEGVNKSFKFIR
jgi:hypothetical protein